jgi:hypothetical protein
LSSDVQRNFCCELCPAPPIDLGAQTLREWTGAIPPKVVAKELAGERFCYDCLHARVIAVAVREYRLWERRPVRKPWGNMKG